MKRVPKIVYFISIVSFIVSCNTGNKQKPESNELLSSRYEKLLNYELDSFAFPRSFSFEDNEIRKVHSRDWTSGFYAGNLWSIYLITGDEKYKVLARKWTSFIEREKYNNRTHDMGFKVFCSFGRGLEIDESQHYKDVVVKSSETLISRYNENVSSIRSWDFNKDKWEFPVIIDNMMNLEMLFEATRISKDSVFHKIAVKHANTTLKNHFRPDGSTWHVLDYDPDNGAVNTKVTHQGLHNDSSWARGQGWAIYGFTMAYRYTKDVRYLNQAKATAEFFLTHKNLPEDGVPYWDFDAPNIPNEPRDVSAGTVVSSALVELYQYTKNQKYLDYSKKVLNTLISEEYILDSDIDAPFILKHSTGNWPKKDEVDESIVYGDYYYLETILRLKSL